MSLSIIISSVSFLRMLSTDWFFLHHSLYSLLFCMIDNFLLNATLCQLLGAEYFCISINICELWAKKQFDSFKTKTAFSSAIILLHNWGIIQPDDLLWLLGTWNVSSLCEARIFPPTFPRLGWFSYIHVPISTQMKMWGESSEAL